jgi:hypothetical protein
MSLKLSKNDVIPYQYYSEGTDLDPISTQVLLDNTGGIKPSDAITAFLVATTFNYTTIVVTPVNDDISIDWKCSLDNVLWSDSVNLSDINALIEDQIVPIYFGVVVKNDGTVGTGNYISCKVRITAVENP